MPNRAQPLQVLQTHIFRLGSVFNFHFSPGLSTFCINKVWKLREALNVRVTAGHRPVQAQEVPAGMGRSSRFLSKFTIFFCKIE